MFALNTRSSFAKLWRVYRKALCSSDKFVDEMTRGGMVESCMSMTSLGTLGLLGLDAHNFVLSSICSCIQHLLTPRRPSLPSHGAKSYIWRINLYCNDTAVLSVFSTELASLAHM
jgi:hypothetical protein